MQSPSPSEQRRKLAAMIAESLVLADQLGLGLVGIALDGALTHLTGHGLAIDTQDGSVH